MRNLLIKSVSGESIYLEAPAGIMIPGDQNQEKDGFFLTAAYRTFSFMKLNILDVFRIACVERNTAKYNGRQDRSLWPFVVGNSGVVSPEA